MKTQNKYGHISLDMPTLKKIEQAGKKAGLSNADIVRLLARRGLVSLLKELLKQ